MNGFIRIRVCVHVLKSDYEFVLESGNRHESSLVEVGSKKVDNVASVGILRGAELFAQLLDNCVEIGLGILRLVVLLFLVLEIFLNLLVQFLDLIVFQIGWILRCSSIFSLGLFNRSLQFKLGFIACYGDTKRLCIFKQLFFCHMK